jgi:hypothetical protein
VARILLQGIHARRAQQLATTAIPALVVARATEGSDPRFFDVELFGGEPSAITGERREVLDRITKLLASISDAELRRAERVLNALLRD